LAFTGGNNLLGRRTVQPEEEQSNDNQMKNNRRNKPKTWRFLAFPVCALSFTHSENLFKLTSRYFFDASSINKVYLDFLRFFHSWFRDQTHICTGLFCKV